MRNSLGLGAVVGKFVAYYHQAKVDLLRAANPPVLSAEQTQLRTQLQQEGKSELEILTDPRLQPADSPEVQSHLAKMAVFNSLSLGAGWLDNNAPSFTMTYGDTFGGDMLKNMQLIMRLAGITGTRTDGVFEIMFGTKSAEWLRQNAPYLGQLGDEIGSGVVQGTREVMSKVSAEIDREAEAAARAREAVGAAAEAFAEAAAPVARSAVLSAIEGAFYMWFQSE